ncbi:MAG: hypothetical protein WAQ05_24455 [Rubrivivax sp.]
MSTPCCADWIDVSAGWLRFGRPRTDVRAVQQRWPDAGLHFGDWRVAASRVPRSPNARSEAMEACRCETSAKVFEGFKQARAADGAKNATINRSLAVVRTVANRAARVRRTNGRSWLSAAPLIEMLDERGQRRPPHPST